MIMLLQAADADVERQPAVARGHLALALETARDNLAEARALVAALALAGLEPGALDAALRMRARVDEAGGRLGVRSSPGCGTTVSVVVPVPDEPASQAVSA